jgi:hypothetical protein
MAAEKEYQGQDKDDGSHFPFTFPTAAIAEAAAVFIWATLAGSGQYCCVS